MDEFDDYCNSYGDIDEELAILYDEADWLDEFDADEDEWY